MKCTEYEQRKSSKPGDNACYTLIMAYSKLHFCNFVFETDIRLLIDRVLINHSNSSVAALLVNKA
jgi:hypothetical protein